MSYILEGLKKLEQKRRQEVGTPGLLAFKEEITPGPEKPNLWPYLLFVALLLNAGVILWWIGPWHSLERPVLTHPAIPGSSPKVVNPRPIEFKNQSPPIPRKELPPPKVSTKHPPGPPLEKRKEGIDPVVGKTSLPKSTPGTLRVSPESLSSSINKVVVPGGPIVKLSDLPSEVKKSLPAIKMSVHFYSPNKQSCFVTINDRTLHEGESLNEDLRVVEINPDGTVLHYRGHRFLISVNENY